MRLLGEKVDGTPLYRRLVAAYVIGCSLPADYFDRVFHEITPCTSATQTGCVIAWDTIGEDAWVPRVSVHRYPTGWEHVGGKALFCVNPLTWTAAEVRAPASAHAGALMAAMVPADVDPDRVELKGISPKHTWAECRKGRLLVADQNGTPFSDSFGIYHLFDYGLFWMNIRANARDRVEAYLRCARTTLDSE